MDISFAPMTIVSFAAAPAVPPPTIVNTSVTTTPRDLVDSSKTRHSNPWTQPMVHKKSRTALSRIRLMPKRLEMIKDITTWTKGTLGRPRPLTGRCIWNLDHF